MPWQASPSASCRSCRTLSLNDMPQDSNQLQIAAPGAPVLEKVGLGAILLAYAVLLGAAYLFAYWRTMGFDIFPYLSVQNYVTAPLNRISVLVAAPALFTVIVFGRTATPENNRYLRDISLYLIVLYSVGFAIQQFQAVSRYIQHDFHFDNEFNVLVLAAVLFAGSLVLSFRVYRMPSSVHMKLAALVLVQAAMATAAGYSDGKAIYNGAAQAFLLENTEICKAGGVRDWVYLGKYGDQTFFLNTIDKRICIAGGKDFRLISRKLREGL
jgi:hypothetical protein